MRDLRLGGVGVDLEIGRSETFYGWNGAPSR
jgi:hypothetical protein